MAIYTQCDVILPIEHRVKIRLLFALLSGAINFAEGERHRAGESIHEGFLRLVQRLLDLLDLGLEDSPLAAGGRKAPEHLTAMRT